MHHIPDEERRARLVRRHHLDRTAGAPLEAVRGVVAFHSSDPCTPHVGLRARVAGFGTADLDAALHDDRSLWRLHAMRRTLFLVPTDDAASVLSAASADVARAERRRLEGWLAPELEGEAPPEWIARVGRAVRELLEDGSERSTRELAAAVPELGLEISVGSGRWAGRIAVGSRLLLLLALDGRIVRTRPAGTWRSSQYGWASARAWFGAAPDEVDPGAARNALARRYLERFGPVTRADVRWWTGWTAKRTDAALEAVGAVPVALDSGEGFALPEDLDAEPDPAPAGEEVVVSLLPALDPSPMGWKERDFFLGPHAAPLFDRNGNVGPTVWLGGRVVGGWGQRADGEVVVRLLEEVGAEGRRRVAEEAAALTAWMDGAPARPRFRTPLERELSEG